jgi:hypothetical protein
MFSARMDCPVKSDNAAPVESVDGAAITTPVMTRRA